MVIRGTAAGGAKFEAIVHEERGAIELGGRLVDPGTLKNPRFSVQVVFQDVYSKSVPAGDEKKIEAFQEKIADDRVLLVLKDRKRVKLSPAEAKDAAEINGPGIEVMEMEMAAYQDNEFEITATGESAMTVTTAGSAAPINKGFTLTWVADPAKDAGNKARLRIEVK